MKTILLSATVLSTAMFFSSCSKTPEEAANEICECYENADGLLDAGGCAMDAAEYMQDYKGEELETFTTKTASCTLGAAGDALDDLKDSEVIQELGDELEEEMGEAIDEIKEDVQDEVEDALEDAGIDAEIEDITTEEEE